MFLKYFHMLFSCFPTGTTPAYFASQEGRVEALKFLHYMGKCGVKIPGDDGLKPIHATSQGGHTGIVQVS